MQADTPKVNFSVNGMRRAEREGVWRLIAANHLAGFARSTYLKKEVRKTLIADSNWFRGLASMMGEQQMTLIDLYKQAS